jgi:ankyrin repeat protein
MLLVAAQLGQRDMISLLLEKGEKVDTQTNEELPSTPLIIAASNGDEKTVSFLIDQCHANLFHAFNGFAAIHIATNRNQRDIIKLLVQRGEDINRVSGSGITPLHIAVNQKSLSTVIMLLSLGANTDAKTTGTDGQRTALELASGRYPPTLLSVLNDLFEKAKQGKLTPITTEDAYHFHQAIQFGNNNAVKEMLDSNIEYAFCTVHGTSTLQRAISAKNHQAVKILIEKGADVEELNVNNIYSSAMHVAAAYGDEKCIDLLYDAGDYVERTYHNNSHSPAHVAVQHNNVEAIKTFLKHDAQIHGLYSKGILPVHDAAGGNRLQILKLLIEGLPNKPTPSFVRFEMLRAAGRGSVNEFLPIHCAVMRGSLASIEYLLEMGSPVRSPSGSFPDILQLLHNTVKNFKDKDKAIQLIEQHLGKEIQHHFSGMMKKHQLCDITILASNTAITKKEFLQLAFNTFLSMTPQEKIQSGMSALNQANAFLMRLRNVLSLDRQSYVLLCNVTAEILTGVIETFMTIGAKDNTTLEQASMMDRIIVEANIQMARLIVDNTDPPSITTGIQHALKYVEMALEIDPNHEIGLMMLISYFSELGNEEKYSQAFERLAQLEKQKITEEIDEDVAKITAKPTEVILNTTSLERSLMQTTEITETIPETTPTERSSSYLSTGGVVVAGAALIIGAFIVIKVLRN